MRIGRFFIVAVIAMLAAGLAACEASPMGAALPADTASPGSQGDQAAADSSDPSGGGEQQPGQEQAQAGLQQDDDDEPRCPDDGRTHPRVSRLADDFGVSYEEIEALFCAGYGLGEIKLAYQMSAESGTAVNAIVAAHEDGQSWGQIKQDLGLIGQGSSDDDNDDDDDDDDEDDDDDQDGGRCQQGNDKEHPQVRRIADENGVEYEEIEAWFCAGYGLGVVKQAYEMAAAADIPVEEIFALAESGMGWGEIKQDLGLIGQGGGDDDEEDEQDQPGGHPPIVPRPDDAPKPHPGARSW